MGACGNSNSPLSEGDALYGPVMDSACGAGGRM